MSDWDRIDATTGLPLDHSVTCHHCGQLADERQTVRLTEGELCPRCVNEHPELLPRVCANCGWDENDNPPALCDKERPHAWEHSAWV